MNGIEKEIDSVGRVVIPATFRKKLDIRERSKVLIYMHEDTIIISPSSKRCVICNKKLTEVNKIKICDDCILKIKSEI